MKAVMTSIVQQLTAQAWKPFWLALALAAVTATLTTAGGTSTNAPEAELDIQSGAGASAAFHYYDDTGCVLANVFLAAEKLHAAEALRYGLVDALADDPIAAALAFA